MSSLGSASQQPQQPPPAPSDGTGSGESQFHIELVGRDGQPILQRPIDVDELLRQHQHSLPIGNGVTVRLEEYQQNAADLAASSADEYDDEDEDDEDEYTDDGVAAAETDLGAQGGARAYPTHRAPPGTREAGGWYDVLNELRRDQQGEHAAKARLAGYSAPGGEVHRVQPGSRSRPVATPMKLFPSLPPAAPPRSRSVEPVAGAAVATKDTSSPQARREVWASFAPPPDPATNYKHLDYISIMDGVSSDGVALPGRRFRPRALSFHAMASYVNAKDNGQRVLVYGGVSSAGMAIQKELYEFSVLTGSWRRLEGKQFVPAGHMGHAMAVAESVDRLIVVGGVGPCGNGAGNQIRPSTFADDAVRALRARLFFPPEVIGKRRSLSRSPSPQQPQQRGPGKDAGAAGGAPTGHVSSMSPAVGFVPFLFDMSLTDQRWRAVQAAQPFPLAFHTVVHFGDQLYVFGGLTEELVVSGQLIAIDVATYALRLVQPADRHRHRRRHHDTHETESPSDEEDGGDEGEDTSEAQGPGPRFLHSAVRYGNYMVVYGGFDAHNEVQSDTWAFDLVNERWEKLRCHGDSPPRAGHTASLVGSRMLVLGGFSCSLEESANSGEGEELGGPATENIIMELNLVPTARGEYVWREEVKTRPPLPPIVYAASAPCGDDASIVMFGGLTKRPKFKPAIKAPEPRATSSSAGGHAGRQRYGRGHEHEHDDADGGDVADTAVPGSTPYLKQLITLDDAVVMTFPMKRHRSKHKDADAPHVNALGVEVDPNEMPESFKTFVRRQEDFVKKKEAAALATQKKITLDEQEAMEPTIYFTEDEIEKTLEKSEELCATFLSYKMDTLPGNVPDREQRIHIIENCISLSRQVRDVVRSMKGSQIAVTAVKSKSHRRRAGQKFEDFSAAKPFRRVVIGSLVDEINEELAVMHTLNKALRTVDWEEKETFKEAIQTMQNTVHGFTGTTNAIMGKYVSHRVEKLVKGVDKHKEVMRLLTEVVQRNRQDKIWGRDEARDQQRGKDKAARDKAARGDAHTSGQPQQRPNTRSASQGRLGDRTMSAQRRRRSTGAGYHADESTACVRIVDREWNSLIARAGKLASQAALLEDWCRQGMASTGVNAATLAPTSPAVVAPPAPGAVPAAESAFPVTVAVPPPPAAAIPRVDDSGSESDDSDTPTAAVPPAVAAPLLPPPPPFPAVPAVIAPPAAPMPEAMAVAVAAAQEAVGSPAPPAGGASPKEILIRRSDANRERAIAVAQHIAEVATSFTAALEKGDADSPTPAASPAPLSHVVAGSDADSRSAKTPSQPTSLRVSDIHEATANVTAVAPSKPSTLATSPASSSSSSSASSSGGSSPAAAGAALAVLAPPPALASVPAAAAPPAVPGVPAIVPLAVLSPQGQLEGSSPVAVEKTQPMAESSKADGVPASTAEAKSPTAAATTVAPPPAPSGYHVLYLRVLRPLLELREEVEKVAGNISLIHVNEWDGNDLAGAPPDTKAERRYRRVKATLGGLIQSITASFLSAAGAKKPRTLSTAARPTAAHPAADHGRHRRRSASAAKKKLAFPSTGASQARESGQEEEHAVRPLPAALPRPEAISPLLPPPPETTGVHRLGKLSGPNVSIRFGEFPLPQAPSADSTEAAAKKYSSPLVSYDSFLRAQSAASAKPESPAPATSESTIVVELASVDPHQRVIRQPAGTAVSAGILAPSTPPHDKPVITVAAGLTFAMPPSAAIPIEVVTSPEKPAVSSIDHLKQLTAAGSPSAAEQPATSIAPGPFVVNPDYFISTYGVAPSGAAPPQPEAPRTHWADAEEDYFYFGKQKTLGRALNPAPSLTYTGTGGAPVLSPSPVVSTATVTASPPVGTVLTSQRLNAVLVGDAAGAGRRPVSAAARPAAPAATARSGTRVLAESTNTLQRRPETSRTAKEESKKRLTPGELQILQGRERLRRHH